MNHLIQLSGRELATVLAGLRLKQNGDRGDIASDAGEIERLDDQEIDELCERINVQPDHNWTVEEILRREG